MKFTVNGKNIEMPFENPIMGQPFFFKCCYLTGISLIYSLFIFHIIYILHYVLMVKDNNTLISSLHVNPIDGVDHLIRLRTRTFSFLVSIPEPPAGSSSSIRRSRRLYYCASIAFLFFFANCFVRITSCGVKRPNKRSRKTGI